LPSASDKSTNASFLPHRGRSSRPEDHTRRTGIAVVGVLAHDFEAAIRSELP